ncbi:MAG: DUF2232 domain-containing protein [Synergistaceae bacterium]|nr:DUF2232 domain-containing protein [Synergistaceae bacterium]
MKSKIIFEWLSWILLSIVMFSGGMYVALASPFLILIAPAPLMVLEIRQGFRESLLGVLFGSVFVFMLFGSLPAFMYALEFGVLGVVFGYISGRTEKGIDFILLSVTASIIAKIILLVTFTSISGMNPFAMSPETAMEIVSSLASKLSSGGIGASDEIIKNYSLAMVETVSLLMPSMIIFFSAIDTFATYWTVSYFIRRSGGEPLPSLPKFETWRFPKNLFWALAAAVIMDLAGKAFPDERVYTVVSANLMEVLRAIFMLEGLSLCWYYMSSRRIAKVIKVIFSLFCILFSPVSYILSMVGIFDIWYDLRTRIRGKKNESDS